MPRCVDNPFILCYPLSMTRQSSMRRAHRLYSAISNSGLCVYCGDIATGMDHFTPISYTGKVVSFWEVVNGVVLLPACTDCNSTASANLFRSVAAKRRYIQARLRKRHHRLLKAPNWTKAELEDLSPTLRGKIKADLAFRNHLLWRLSWRNNQNSAVVSIAMVSLKLTTENGRGSAPRSTNRHGTTCNGRDLSLSDEAKRELWKNLSSQLGQQAATETMEELEKMDRLNACL